jgi:hypothetical protein
MLEAAGASETSVNVYQTTLHNNPENSHLQVVRLFFRELQSFFAEFAVGVFSWSVGCLVNHLRIFLFRLYVFGG